ncbi:MAG TPA: hypothetical protein PKC43_08485 [Phycisphaerales bacterium]|nr:hypothetical protein [Phycisphaerales bacterium]HMP37472.1 hypothetical protein [Phycisphaerales bacterium]
MILLLGIPTEPPLAMVRERLDAMGAAYTMLSQRDALASAVEVAIGSGAEAAITGRIEVDGRRIALERCVGAYLRPMDESALPEVADDPPGSPRRRRLRAWHDALMTWSEVTPARIVNRISAMGSNASKPFQAQSIMACGFLTPETLVSNDPLEVRRFHSEHGRVIFKSMSGVRSIVRELDAEDFGRLDAIRWCPVQFQAFVPGENVRVHVVGERVFATRILSEATDYRYAAQQVGESALLEAAALDAAIEARCVELAQRLDLPFAGIDLKFTPQGETYCFEVNPSPGYSYYEANTGQPISLAVAEHLAG